MIHTRVIRSHVNRRANTRIGTAAADISVHCRIDIGIGGVRRFFQQR
jgi:hypothetical protein